jgi:hypothetical protein
LQTADVEHRVRIKSTFATDGTPKDSAATVKHKQGKVKELLEMSNSDSALQSSTSSLSQAVIIND